MKRQRSRALLAMAFGLTATHAWADGTNWPFSGAYVGVAAGYAQHRVEVTNLDPGAPAFGSTFKDTEGAFTFGGYLGYNWQFCSYLLFGIEADFNYLNSSPTAHDIEVFAAGIETTSLESSIDWFGTLRGRLGYVVQDYLLIYGTGGLAYGKADHTLSDNCPACVGGFTGFPVSQSNDVTKAGWTVGGGAEYLYDTHWFLRAEALFVDLGSHDQSYRFVLPVGTATTTAKWDDQFWVARLGVSYKFSD
jgi:outer membrane immunogenic protein